MRILPNSFNVYDAGTPEETPEMKKVPEKGGCPNVYTFGHSI